MKSKFPASFDIVEDVTPVLTFCRVTLLLTKTAPVPSLTVPRTVAVSNCARTAAGAMARNTARTRWRRENFMGDPFRVHTCVELERILSRGSGTCQPERD